MGAQRGAFTRVGKWLVRSSLKYFLFCHGNWLEEGGRKNSLYEGSEGGEDPELSQGAIQEEGELRRVSFTSSPEQVPFQQRTSLPWAKMGGRKPLLVSPQSSVSPPYSDPPPLIFTLFAAGFPPSFAPLSSTLHSPSPLCLRILLKGSKDQKIQILLLSP